MVSTSKKPRFEATNTDDIKHMPSDVRRLWQIMEKQDPNGDVFVNDVAIIVLEGEGPKDRTPQGLKLLSDDVALLRPFGVLDGPKANDPETAVGVIFTPFQMVQLAYELGRQAEQRKVASDFKKVVSAPVVNDYGEDEDEDESFDDEMAVVDEDEDDHEVDDNDNEEDEDEDEA